MRRHDCEKSWRKNSFCSQFPHLFRQAKTCYLFYMISIMQL
jgi:hypothetical protein